MNFSIAFHEGDKDQVQRWLDWVAELGGMGRHKLWLMPVKGLAADFITTLPFEIIQDNMGVRTDWSKNNEEVRDAAGANSMMRQLCWHFYLKKAGAWTFMEPDAIPLREGWHDAWEDEYNRERKHFMGAFVPGKVGQYPHHLTGVAVYSEKTVELSPKLMMLPTQAHVDGTARVVEMAFDVAAAPDILKHCHHTKLIQHVFRGPVFKDIRDLDRIDKEAVIWHSDKDGGLIKLLRAKRQGISVVECHQDDGVKAVASDAGSIPAPVAKRTGTPVEAPSLVVSGSTPDNGNSGSIPDPVRLRVHTYFRPCVGREALEEQKRILAIWEKNWSDAGWQPVILTEAHARQHPEFEKYRAAFEMMPTVSPKEYEMACWLRWVAMAAVGGGVMTDYDVLNNGWTPEMVPKWACDPEMAAPFIYSTNNPVPCVVSGSKNSYQFAIANFAASTDTFREGGKKHISDQLLIQKWGWSSNDTCRECGTNGWREAKLIHFSHRSCSPGGRSIIMKEFVEKHDAPVVMGLAMAGIVESDPQWNIIEGKRSIMDQIRERLVWIKENSRGITRHHVHRELKALGLLPKK